MFLRFLPWHPHAVRIGSKLSWSFSDLLFTSKVFLTCVSEDVSGLCMSTHISWKSDRLAKVWALDRPSQWSGISAIPHGVSSYRPWEMITPNGKWSLSKLSRLPWSALPRVSVSHPLEHVPRNLKMCSVVTWSELLNCDWRACEFWQVW